ncbi:MULTISPECIES: LPS export ABC transporter permease LptF [Novosphingobium]|uniref:LPS export ABC transporter permease LptF n=1 Tax=Novosphingobium mangrovi (ex Hu et al. 2023) TaxID=2930094 RepID=A0ABT0ACN7_9SPHN|nr:MULTISPECIES: LPS export ABC transporter permease LptF [Novosphingobium]MCJ1960957.1 LPS export ABC transporter permease LptF [Novosphingobium mangrovi (ex Hu et al. 2023)]
MKFLNAIDRYILRLVLMPMLGIFVLAASLLVLDKMLRLFDFVATEGGPVGVVFKLLVNMLPEYASLAIPLGLMLGILLAFRKLATSSELDVMRAVGLSYTRMLRVPYMITLVLVGVNFAIVGYLQPLSRYYYEELNYELQSGALGASIKVGEFTTLEDRIALRIDASEDEGRRLMGIFARVANSKGQVLSISAREGRFMALQGSPDTIILRLENGQIIQDMPGDAPRVLSFTRHDLPIDLPAIENFRQRGGQSREYLLPELMQLGWNKDSPQTAEERASSKANFNYRMVEVVMMLLLPLLAVALAIPPKRSTSSLGLFVSIVIIVAYHKVNQYASDVAALGRIDPVIGLWGPFLVLAGLILWMYYRVAYVPGGQAIGWLEKGFEMLTKRLKSLLRRRRRSHGPVLPEPQDQN